MQARKYETNAERQKAYRKRNVLISGSKVRSQQNVTIEDKFDFNAHWRFVYLRDLRGLLYYYIKPRNRTNIHVFGDRVPQILQDLGGLASAW